MTSNERALTLQRTAEALASEFPGCAVIVAIGSCETGVQFGSIGPSHQLTAELALQVTQAILNSPDSDPPLPAAGVPQ